MPFFSKMKTNFLKRVTRRFDGPNSLTKFLDDSLIREQETMTLGNLKVFSSLRGKSCHFYVLSLFEKFQDFNFNGVERIVINSGHNFPRQTPLCAPSGACIRWGNPRQDRFFLVNESLISGLHQGLISARSAITPHCPNSLSSRLSLRVHP